MTNDSNHLALISKIIPDIEEWPESWAGDDDDLEVGEYILKFILGYLAQEVGNKTPKTLRTYGDYLWLLGGEIIRETNGQKIKAKKLTHDFFNEYISEYGGPYCRHIESDKENTKYNNICKKFHKFIMLSAI